MNELTDSRPLWGSTQAGWLFAAAVAGVVAGTVVSGGVDVTRALLAIAGGALALLVLWRYQFGIVLMLLVMPLDIYGRIITSPVTVTAFHVTLLLTLAAFGLHVLRTGERVRFSVIDLAMGALVLAALISLPDSLNQGATALGAIRLFFLWLFVLLWANMLKTRALADRATALLVATGVGTALLALAQYFVPGFEFGSMRMVHRDGQTLVRAGALFWDPNYMAAFLSITFLVALALVIHARTWRATAVWTAASGILAAGVIVTFSRTGWVGVVAGVVVLLLTAPARRRIPLLLVMVAIGTTMFSVNPGLIMDRVSSIGAGGKRQVDRHPLPYALLLGGDDSRQLGTRNGSGCVRVRLPRIPSSRYTAVHHQTAPATARYLGGDGGCRPDSGDSAHRGSGSHILASASARLDGDGGVHRG